ncbi:MAG: hypothetical protein P8173_18215 [Gammaproteobacteria bacterium]
MDRFIEMAPRVLAILGPSDDVPAGSLEDETSKRNSTAEILDAVEGIMMVHGAPIRPAALVRMLAEQGIVVGGQRPPNDLSGMLSYATDRFQNIGGHGWVLKRRAAQFRHLADAEDLL